MAVEKDSLYFDQHTPIRIDKRADSYAIRVVDWNRLRRAVEFIPNRQTLWGNAAWSTFGISATFLLGALTLPDLANLGTWIRPTCWVGAIGCLVYGVLALVMQRSHDKTIASNREFCLHFISDIEGGFSSQSPLINALASPERLPADAEERLSISERKLPTSSEPLKTDIHRGEPGTLIKSLETNVARSILGKRQRQEDI